MIDRELVNRKINLIAPDLSELEAVAARGVEAFLDDRINQVLAERYLERVIGRIIDINYHILTETGKPPPRIIISLSPVSGGQCSQTNSPVESLRLPV